MIKRISRSALALAAAGLLVSPFVAQTANAQTVTVNPGVINATARFNPAVPPAGVTGVTVVYTCSNFFTGATLTTGPTAFGNATIAPTSGVFATNIGLTATAPGTSCIVTATMAGTANVASPAITITVGGREYSVGSATSPLTAGATAANGAIPHITPAIPFFSSTDVVINVTFPVITVRKVIVGDEAAAGFAYPMTITCSGSTTSTGGFVVGLAGNLTPATTYNLLGAGFTNPAGVVVAPGSLVLPGGAGFFVSIQVPNVLVAGDVVTYNFYDYRSTPPASSTTVINSLSVDASIFGSSPTLGSTNAGLFAQLLAATSATTSSTSAPLAPNAAAGFTGSFTLTGAGTTASRTFTNNEFAGLSGSSRCEVIETNAGGMPVTLYSSSTATAGVTLPGVGGTATTGAYRSALTSMGQTVTVTNASYGDLVVSKVVTGDPKTNIATYEVSVSCDKGGPKDTFLLKDRQSKVYQNITTGTNCLITETKSDGATPSYADNSGDNTTDGRVVIKRRGSGCAAVGSPTAASPGGPAPTTVFDECWANVIITNSYVVASTTAAPAPSTTAAPATTVAPAPAPSPAPAEEIIDEPTFTG